MPGKALPRSKRVFLTGFLFAHRYAGIIADNSPKYDGKRANAG